MTLTSWTIIDAEDRHRQYATFKIPSPEIRTKLRKGDSAKLCFEREESSNEDDSDDSPAAHLNGERMWVRVTKVLSDGHYIGVLENHPNLFEDLEYGDSLEFEARHVIDADLTN